jgi:hypothetical protein
VKDSLAGKREGINAGEVYSLIWLDDGSGCPVETGERHELRSCRIQITKTHRIQKKQAWEFEGDQLPAGWYWRAEFETYWKVSGTPFLARRGGTTSDRKQAMAMQDDEEPGTLRAISEDERDPVAATQHAALGSPPEAAVPKHEIPNLLGSREARQRYEFDMAERRMQEADAPLEQRLVRLREMASQRHIDITTDLRAIERRLGKIEDKVLERAAA